MIKNELLRISRNFKIIRSDANEDRTHSSIWDLGAELAEEVQKYLLRYEGEDIQINFVCHSMGGLIVRAALPKLIMYKERMNRFICFASPHLGNVYSKSKLVRLGMWGFRFWYKSESLNQMAYADANNVRNTAMYELSKEPGLDWFIDVTLISSTQDTYCPLESGRIQSSDQID